jgi:TonB family protein
LASLVLHAALSVLLLVDTRPTPERPPVIVVELTGIIAEQQVNQRDIQEAQGEREQKEVKQDEPATPALAQAAETIPEEGPKEIAEDETLPPPTPAETKQDESPGELRPMTEQAAAGNGSNTIVGAEEQQIAQVISEADEKALIAEYLKALSKKVQDNLVFPQGVQRDRRRYVTVVSFALSSSGAILPNTLKIRKSSGQAKIDESALQTMRNVAPFAPPPKDMTVSIDVDFGRLDRR